MGDGERGSRDLNRFGDAREHHQQRWGRPRHAGPGHRPGARRHRAGHRGQAGGRPARPGRAAGRGAPAHRGRARRRQDDAEPRRWPAPSTARSAASSSPPTCCPRDVTGVSVFNQDSREFEFRPGGVFANIVVGDEINRASPKTQSALLECMEERQVTVDGSTYHLESPFMVIATQNPIEMEGTYALPGGPARPLHGAGVDGLPRRGGGDRHARQPHPLQPARRPRAGHRRGRDPQADRDRRRRATSPRRSSATPSRSRPPPAAPPS